MKVLSFSLWGDNPKYTVGAIKNSELAKKYNQLNYTWSHKDIIRISNNLSRLYASIRRYSDQYLLLEMNLIKLLEFDSSIDIEEFLKKDI